jgi:uncharacterized protein with von Willebrand factor type A (vWA) domain
MDTVLENFIRSLRRSGVRISIAEALEAFETVRQIGFTDRELFRDALASVLAKSVIEKKIFMECFDRFFSPDLFTWPAGEDDETRAVKTIAQENRSLSQMMLMSDHGGLAAALSMAAREENLPGMRFFTQKNLYALRIMERMGSQALDADIRMLQEQGSAESMGTAARLEAGREALTRNVRNLVTRQLDLVTKADQKQSIDDMLRNAKLNQLDQQHLQRMHVIIQRLVKQLNDIHSRRRKAARRGALDFKKTIRKNVTYQGMLFDTQWKRKKVERPQVIAICDISRSVQRVVRFLLLFLYSLNKTIIDIRSFVFCSDLAEVTDIFNKYRIEEALVRLQSGADIPVLMGRTDYDRSFRDFKENHLNAVTRKTTVLIIGDARNNYADTDINNLKTIYRRCKKLIWLNPDIPSYWGSGDSEIKKFMPYCHLVRECNTLNHLERLVGSLIKAH